MFRSLSIDFAIEAQEHDGQAVVDAREFVVKRGHYSLKKPQPDRYVPARVLNAYDRDI